MLMSGCRGSNVKKRGILPRFYHRPQSGQGRAPPFPSPLQQNCSSQAKSQIKISQRARRRRGPTKRKSRHGSVTMSTKKRKADELSTGGDADPSAAAEAAGGRPVLPATSLASVLNFLPYSDVRTSLLAGKAVAIDAAKHIETLNIMNPSGLDAPAARRFVNVSEVNILCIFRWDNDEDRYVSSADAATRTPLFLTTMPKLRRVYVGGINRLGQRLLYNRLGREGHHRATFRALVESFCAAFKARMLPPDLEVLGVLSLHRNACDPLIENPDRPCRFCRSICTSFPLAAILKLRGSYVDDDGDIVPGNICISDGNRFKIMRARPGGADIFQTEEATMLLIDALDKSIRLEWAQNDNHGKEFFARMERLGAEPNGHIYYIEEYTLKRVEELVVHGFNPGMVSKEVFYNEMDVRSPEIWDRATINCLVAMGFPFDVKDVILVDRSSELGLGSFSGRLKTST